MSTVLVLGSGVAGISCALAAAELGAEVLLVTPGEFDEVSGAASAFAGGNTAMAQGGIAAALGAEDDWRLHAADTIVAGAGLVDELAAAQLTEQGAAAMRRLIGQGFAADRVSASDGERTGISGLALGMEAAHSRARIVHAGEDRTGAALHAFLSARLRLLCQTEQVTLIERCSAVSLSCDAGAVSGALLRGAAGALSAVRADAVVLATGGYGAIYPQSSNHDGARGEGIVLAARAGAAVSDLEFVQFHPTVLAATGLLISEAVRGAGAVLRDGSGERFMLGAHPAAELAPRDVVSRTIHRVLRERGEAQVWLDATGIELSQGAGTLARRFPKLTEAASAHGYDWAREAIPVAPAAHYTMGGVVTDLDGRSGLPGLFAAGEVACTGVHGANRLASNSLLEGLVFGARAALAAVAYAAPVAEGGGEWMLRGTETSRLIETAEQLPPSPGLLPSSLSEAASAAPASNRDEHERGRPHPSLSDSAREGSGEDPENGTERALRAAIAQGLGIERDAQGLSRVAQEASRSQGALADLVGMIACAAESRTESRGSHQRADHPAADSAQQHRRAWAVRHSSVAVAAPSAGRADAVRDRSIAPC